MTRENTRYTLFPIVDDKIYELYKLAESSFWVSAEVDLSKDRKDFETKLNDNERHFVKHILAFFAGSDGIVAENLVMRFYSDTKLAEARLFYGFQIMIEGIHSEMYSLMIDNLITDNAEKELLFNAINTMPAIKEKADFCFKYIDSEADYATRLIAFLAVEGIFFSGAFCSIFWLKSKNVLPGLSSSNHFISRDESLHALFAVEMFKREKQKPNENQVRRIIKEAVQIEKKFITESLPARLLGMNDDLMGQYIEFIADYWMRQLGFKEIYKAENPFIFMQTIGMENKTNFFEHRPTEYQKARVDFDLTLNEDF